MFFLYKKRKNIFSSLRRIPTVSVDYHHIILKKRDSNRVPLDVRKLNEEFFRLENQLAGSNIRMRLASLAQNEINAKHTRFKDIGIICFTVYCCFYQNNVKLQFHMRTI